MHTLNPYGIKMCDKVEGKQGYPLLGSLMNGRVDAFELIKSWIEEQQKIGAKLDDRSKTSMVFRDDFVFDITNRRIYGWICTGHYGQENTVLNVFDPTKSYVKGEEYAELIPHFIYFYLPAAKSDGLVLFHSVRGVGTKSIFLEMLNKECRLKYDRVFQMKPKSYEKALRAWQKALTKEIKATPKTNHSDLADKVKDISPEAQTVISIKAPKLGNFGTWGSFGEDNTRQHKLLEVLEQDYENITATVQRDGKTRKVRLGTNITDKICTIEAPDELELNGGSPKTESILDWCEMIRSDFLA
ncbi:hypothetical protein ABEF86_16705 (plasmid) [Acinetobacter thermotolerans]|uniref:hypothetical protein n=1 Tax=Acinetobacter thermotolerans TaxID=3151487 RepID=UPI00325A881F